MHAYFQAMTNDNCSPQGLSEYILVGNPGNGVTNKIIDNQASMIKTVGEEGVSKRSNHIELAHFYAGEGMEDTLVKWIQRIMSVEAGFMITLVYSGSLTNTICLRVQDPAPFQQLAKKLQPVDEFIRASGCPPLQVVAQPHLYIDGSLTMHAAEHAGGAYAGKIFHPSFMLEELVLLRRRNTFGPCKTVQVFRLRPADSNLFCGAA